MSDPTQEIPLRLAFRQEGNVWTAYVAERESMENATFLGSIAIGAVQDSEEIKQDFIHLMQKVLAHAIKVTIGKDISRWNKPEPAPESERAGHA